MTRLSTGLLLVLFCASSAFAQIEGGSITGTLYDEQGGVLPGAVVTVAGSDGKHSSTSNAQGAYRFLNLAPGVYTVSAALDGFSALTREGVVVAVGRDVHLPLTLKVGSISETVRVTMATPLVDVRPVGTSTNFSSAELAAIPTSRDPFALMRSVPGVLLDRVNVGGNETGQAPSVASKGTRPQDTVWTLDGVVITDMAAIGTSPTYFNFDNFDEIHVATAGQDIRQQTGGLGVNLVTKRGTNSFHGGLRGYFNNDALESSNVPAELAALPTPVTPDTADHTERIADYGGEVGGPIAEDKAWFYASYSMQDIRLVRRAGELVDRTELKNPTLKVNWLATRSDMVSFLFFNGSKIKEGRSPGFPGILFDAPTATFRQDNAYTGFPLHGLWKVGNDRVLGSNLFVSAKFAYYNTGNLLTPMGGMDTGSGRSLVTGRSYGSTVQTLNIRPQKSVNADASSLLHAWGAAHDVKGGFGFRTVDAVMQTEWPGNGVLALENSATDLRAQVFRQGNGANRLNFLNLYVGDSIAFDRLTMDLGVRYDRQWGVALASVIEGSRAFPELVPGLTFPGYDAPFTWNNFSPRAGLTYAVGTDGRTVARLTFSRFAGQLNSATVGYVNPSATAGSATYRWADQNGDHLAQTAEVLIDQRLTQGGGFNPTNPTAVTSANAIDPDLKAPVTRSIVAGLERELRPHLAVQASYTNTRTTDLFGNFSSNITPRTGVTLADYSPGTRLTGTLPDGAPYDVPTWVANGAKVVAGGLGFLVTNVPGYSTDYHGVEFGMVKRLSDRWMGRVAISFNNAREHFDDPAGLYDTNGNPTPTITEPLVDGGQLAPQSTASSGSGSVYLNARWQFNANGMYITPHGMELSANVFGRQGYPFPLYRSAALGGETLSVLITPKIDHFRYDDLWTTDVRVARAFRVQSTELKLVGDVFNLFNANTVLVRNNNFGSTTFNQIAQNLSPRILRLGVVVGF